MAKPYSEDLRARVVGAVEDGATIPEAAKQCWREHRLCRALSATSPQDVVASSSAKFGGYKEFVLAAHEDLVRQLVAEQPDITLAELEDPTGEEEGNGRRVPRSNT